jgi:putative membrane protein
MIISPTMGLILHWVVSAVGLLLTAYFVPGFVVTSFGAALFAAAIIGFANWTINPILQLFALPVTVLTGGLFIFVVYGLVLKLCSVFVPGFSIKGWKAAIIGALVLTLLDMILHFYLI